MSKQKSVTGDSNKAWTVPNFLLAVSALLTLQFIYNVCWVSQQYAFYSVENSMKTYNAVIALFLVAYVWLKSGKTYQKYVIISIVTILVMGYIVWLLGDTGVGSYLRNANGLWS